MLMVKMMYAFIQQFSGRDLKLITLGGEYWN